MNDTNKSWAWWKYFICVGIILIGIFAGIELINMFGASSGEYGSPITIETVQGLEVVENYDFGILELNDIDGDNVYTLTASYAPIDFNGTQTKYSLMFNSQPVQNIKLESGAIAGSLTMTFYNTSGTEITNTTLYIDISFYANSTMISFSMENINESISYFTSYMTYNGANLKLVQEVER